MCENRFSGRKENKKKNKIHSKFFVSVCIIEIIQFTENQSNPTNWENFDSIRLYRQKQTKRKSKFIECACVKRVFIKRDTERKRKKKCTGDFGFRYRQQENSKHQRSKGTIDGRYLTSKLTDKKIKKKIKIRCKDSSCTVN